MRYEYTYDGKADRQKKIREAESLGQRMLHDNLNTEPRGVMIFTDEPSPPPMTEVVRNLLKEFDDLKAEVLKLKGR